MKTSQLIEVLNSLLETRIGDSYIVNKYSPNITGSEAICRYKVFLRAKEIWNNWKEGKCYFKTIKVKTKKRTDPMEVIQMLVGDEVILDSRYFSFPEYVVDSKKFKNEIEIYLRDNIQETASLVLNALNLDTEFSNPIENLNMVSWIDVEKFKMSLEY